MAVLKVVKVFVQRSAFDICKLEVRSALNRNGYTMNSFFSFRTYHIH